jgi:hypothetical protein
MQYTSEQCTRLQDQRSIDRSVTTDFFRICVRNGILSDLYSGMVGWNLRRHKAFSSFCFFSHFVFNSAVYNLPYPISCLCHLTLHSLTASFINTRIRRTYQLYIYYYSFLDFFLSLWTFIFCCMGKSIGDV